MMLVFAAYITIAVSGLLGMAAILLRPPAEQPRQAAPLPPAFTIRPRPPYDWATESTRRPRSTS